MSPLQPSWVATILLWGLGIILALWIYWADVRKLPPTALIVLGTITVGVLLLLFIQVFGHDGEDAGPVERPPVARVPAVESEQPHKSEQPHIYVRERSARELLGTVNSLPPLERPAYFNKAYEGKWVRWSGIVFGINEGFGMPGRDIRVTVLDSLPIKAVLNFPPAERASLESLRSGDSIMYEGMIDGRLYDPFLIYLDEPKILQMFPDTTP